MGRAKEDGAMGNGITYHNDPVSADKAKLILSLPLEDKWYVSNGRIDQWFTAWGGKCYVSFSGGKDSTVLAYMAAQYLASYKNPPWPLNLVFVNTGLEYPEVQRFVNDYAKWLQKKFPRVTVNLVRLRPKMSIRQIVTKYGYSVVSKEVADCIADAKSNPNGLRMRRLRGEDMRRDGKPSVYNCPKWEYLLYAPFDISAKCCAIMKKTPLKAYAHKTEQQAIVATMAAESRLRMTYWLKTGCNAFDGKRPMSKPMSFWTEQDVLRFIVDRQLPYASVYGEIVANDGENDYDATLTECPLHCTGCQRTGCMFCAFGAHLEKGENRFERMKHTHPKHYEFCIGGGAYDPVDGLWKPTEKGLGYARVLDYIGVRY